MPGLVFLNVAWMKRYGGLGQDPPRGGGSFVREHGYGYEIFNFRPFLGSMYGFVETGVINGKNRRLYIDRLGAMPARVLVSGVLAVWVATDPGKGGRRIVGWYDNATVFREVQNSPAGADRRLPEGQQAGYFVSAAKDGCLLLPPAERTFPIPSASKDGFGFGRANVWFAEEAAAAGLRAKVAQYVQKQLQDVEAAKRKYGPGGEGLEHKALKEWCVLNPEALGLKGVIGTGSPEYIFEKTGDRADIAFEMTGGRYTMVEVETDIPEPGAYQALKYRTLMCAEKALPITSERVEGLLVAWQVSPSVRDFCKKYGLRYVEVPPSVVTAGSQGA